LHSNHRLHPSNWLSRIRTFSDEMYTLCRSILLTGSKYIVCA
jgi:hypothetical protein